VRVLSPGVEPRRERGLLVGGVLALDFADPQPTVELHLDLRSVRAADADLDSTVSGMLADRARPT
jgi:hypothetical protein